MTTDTLISKVQKLLRLSTSSNANEAAMAAAKAQSLIDEHNLTAAMLALDSSEPVGSDDDEPIMDFYKAGAPLDSAKGHNLDRWRAALALTIAKLNGCRVYKQGGSLALVGRPTDAETVRYLYAYFTREVERLAAVNGVGFGKTWRNNFRLGVIDTITQKLNEQHRQFVEQAREHADNSQALMRVNSALARIESRGATVDAWLGANMKLRKGPAYRTTYNPSARAAGRAAGQSIHVGAARSGLTSGAKALKS